MVMATKVSEAIGKANTYDLIKFRWQLLQTHTEMISSWDGIYFNVWLIVSNNN